MKTQLTFVRALSSLHAGVGQGAGVIDLPIAREKTTGIPYLPGSSLKGALRTRSFNEFASQKTENEETADSKDQSKSISEIIFGPGDVDYENAAASLVQFTDQRLLLLPVRSLNGTFAWITSPFILRRLLRDIKELQQTTVPLTVPIINSIDTCLLAGKASNNEAEVQAESVLPLKIDNTPKVYLEDLDLQYSGSLEVTAWARWLSQQIFPDDSEWQTMLRERICLVHDSLFSFLLQTGTEINTRIRLQEDTKTVTKGGLWYEETLPSETILTGLVLATPRHIKQEDAAKEDAAKKDYTEEEVLEHIQELTSTIIQLGGKATVGRGLCRVIISNDTTKGTSSKGVH
jgi:CRISPR type III-B/RAMP module RAMP protein Cmr4